MERNLGTTIAFLRKSQNMTQAQLAEKMNVTDKAVSKWERNLSCPDIESLPHLAEVLGVTVDQLMQSFQPEKQTEKDIIPLILSAVSIAMGVAVAVLSVLQKISSTDGFALLGIGLACCGLKQLKNK